MINRRSVLALVKRELRMYFTNPTGYVFITLFIFLSAAAAFWQERFFLNNLATLDQLNAVFPVLLLFFVPALTMGIWAEERKQGTDELLLTMPATDLDIVIGKYLGALAIYTVALVLSLSHVAVLLWLGSPDLGLLFGNYLGYWFVGAALIAVGMLASLLAPNLTVAFILGAALSALFVSVHPILGLLHERLGEAAARVGVVPHFQDFARGILSFANVLYFVFVAGLLLYLNVVLLGRRHWPRNIGRLSMSWHHAIRAVALAVALVSAGALIARADLRADVTAERLHSLSPETRRILREIPADRPVFVQAFVSREVPEMLVQVRENALNVLREMDAEAGGRLDILIHDTEPFTREATLARDEFGIQPVEAADPGARASAPVFFGFAFISGAEEEVIPFFDPGLPVEYEFARSVRVVSRTAKKRVGVVNSEINLFGGFDFKSFRNAPPWPVVEELKKQYDVAPVNAEQPIESGFDGLLAALPSSLPQEALDNLQAAIRSGTPALLLDDPLTVFDLGLSASERAGANVNPFQRSGGPPPKEKGNSEAFYRSLGVAWINTEIAWDLYNPHPDLARIQPEIVFVGEGTDTVESFGGASAASAGLQELVLLYPGVLEAADAQDGAAGSSASGFQVTPLLRTSARSGSLPYQALVQRNFLFGAQLMTRGIPHEPDHRPRTLAVATKGQGVDAIVVADVDFISEQFFELRRRGLQNLNFDNVSFLLNCMDVLAGDDSFVELRKKRVRHRTLERVENRTREFVDRRMEDQKEAQAEADKALQEAQARLDAKVAELRGRADLDEQARAIMTRNLQEVENRRFETLKANIEAARETRIQKSKEVMESEVRRIESNIKTLAVLLPPIPVFAMGVVIFARRRRRELEGAVLSRRLRSE